MAIQGGEIPRSGEAAEHYFVSIGEEQESDAIGFGEEDTQLRHGVESVESQRKGNNIDFGDNSDDVQGRSDSDGLYIDSGPKDVDFQISVESATNPIGSRDRDSQACHRKHTCPVAAGGNGSNAQSFLPPKHLRTSIPEVCPSTRFCSMLELPVIPVRPQSQRT